MRMHILWAALLAAVIFSPIGLTSVHAQDGAPAQIKGVTIAVVDVEGILEQAKAAKAVRAQVDEKRKGFLAEVESEEKKLREEQKAIEKEKDKISKEELLKKAKSFEEKRLAARKKLQESKAKLDKAYGETMAELTKAIYDSCQKIADSRKIDLVITRQNIIVGSMSLDITKDVLAGLDAALPSLSLKVK